MCTTRWFPTAGLLAGALIALCSSCGSPVSAQEEAKPVRTVLSGVYTAAQAERGKAVYDQECASCHREDLTGFNGPPLKGSEFMERWREFNLVVLFDLIQQTMPRATPGSLTPQQYLDIEAYMLQANGVPVSATQELTAALLPDTLLVGKDGPMPLPSSAMVEAFGCLAQDKNVWVLEKSSEPARTLDAYELTEKEAAAGKDKAIGSQRYRLQGLAEVEGFAADDAKGSKLEVKGILVRQADNPRINVTAARVVDSRCR